MSKILPAVLLLGVGGSVAYFGAQAFIPASPSAVETRDSAPKKI